MRDWELFTQALERMARDSGAALVDSARQRGVERLKAELLREVDERHAALTRPLHESEERLAKLKAVASEAEQASRQLKYLFDAEQDRLTRDVEERTRALAQGALQAGIHSLKDSLAAASGLRRGKLRRAAEDAAQSIGRAVAERWKKTMTPEGEARYREATGRLVAHANDFLRQLASAGAGSGAQLPAELDSGLGFTVKSRLFYTDLMALTGGFGAWLVDQVMPRRVVLSRVERFGVRYLERLVNANSARVAADLNERTLESRRRLEAEIRARLRAISGVAECALALAREERGKGESAVQAELARLAFIRQQLATTLTFEPP
jgi:hypothetical protein